MRASREAKANHALDVETADLLKRVAMMDWEL
jgi:hypothetical protein